MFECDEERSATNPTWKCVISPNPRLNAMKSGVQPITNSKRSITHVLCLNAMKSGVQPVQQSPSSFIQSVFECDEERSATLRNGEFWYEIENV